MPSARVISFRARLLSLLLVLLPVGLEGQQTKFRSGVELIRLDVAVVTDDGTPVPDLAPGDFEVTIKGEPRHVVSAQFLTSAVETGGRDTTPQPGDFSSNSEPGGRLFLIVVDETTLQPGNERALIEGLRGFLGSLPPRDRAALITLPGTTARVDFTSDTAVLRAAADRLHAWPAEEIPRRAIKIDRGEGGTTAPAPPATPAQQVSTDFDRMVDSLVAMADALKPVEGPKTLLLIAGRLPGGARELATSQRFARRAAEARLKVYAIRHFAVSADAQSGTGSNEGPEDPLTGFHLLAGMAGGAVFDAVARAKGVWERVDRESSGGYVLGIDPPPGAAPDTPLEVRVKVRRPGVTVRSGTQVLLPAGKAAGKDPAIAVREALQLPRPVTELPVRVATYVARGADPAQLKTIVVAEIAGLGTNQAAMWAYDVRKGGQPIANNIERPSQGTDPGTLTTVLNLAPGTYSLRLAVAGVDGRLGSVEHTMVVAPHGNAQVGISDLFVGDATNGRFQPRIRVDRSAQALVAFVEVYAANGDYGGVTVDFELEGVEGPTGVPVAGSLSGGGGKRVAQAALPLRDLEVGRYRVSAIVRAGDVVIDTVQRDVMLE